MPKDIFEQEEQIIDWSVIENYEKEDTIASYSMALAELVKLLNFLLEDQGYIAPSLDEKVKKAKLRFTNIKDLKKALQTYNKIFKEYSELVNLLDIKEAIKALKQSVRDLISKSDYSPPGLLERIKASLDYLDKEKFYNFALSFAFVIILIFVLDSTHFGQKFISVLASFLGSILSWLILAGLILLALAILLIGTILFVGRGK